MCACAQFIILTILHIRWLHMSGGVHVSVAVKKKKTKAPIVQDPQFVLTTKSHIHLGIMQANTEPIKTESSPCSLTPVRNESYTTNKKPTFTHVHMHTHACTHTLLSNPFDTDCHRRLELLQRGSSVEAWHWLWWAALQRLEELQVVLPPEESSIYIQCSACIVLCLRGRPLELLILFAGLKWHKQT